MQELTNISSCLYHSSFFIEGEEKSKENSFTRKVCPWGFTLFRAKDKWFSPIGNLLLFYINVSFGTTNEAGKSIRLLLESSVICHFLGLSEVDYFK